jgi:hypothetical protein
MVPCEKCVVLAICKAKIQEGNSYYRNIHQLIKKCVLLREYILQRGGIYRTISDCILCDFTNKACENVFKIITNDRRVLEKLQEDQKMNEL